MNKLKSVMQEVNFDGCNFWLQDIKIGRISKKLQFQSPIPRDIMDSEKSRCLGKIIGDTQ